MSDTIITAAAMRVIKLLVGHPPRKVLDLIDETGLTRTAVTEQLKNLAAGGFIVRVVEHHSGRGRPRHRYMATQAALALLFANNQQLVVPTIWEAVNEVGGEDLVQTVLHAVSHRLAEHYRAKITASDPQTRIKQFRAILKAEGGLIDLENKQGQITLSKRTCAFISMLDNERHVCTIDLDVMSAIAGCPVRRMACRLDGAPCCRFEIDARPSNGSPAKRIAGEQQIVTWDDERTTEQNPCPAESLTGNGRKVHASRGRKAKKGKHGRRTANTGPKRK